MVRPPLLATPAGELEAVATDEAGGPDGGGTEALAHVVDGPGGGPPASPGAVPVDQAELLAHPRGEGRYGHAQQADAGRRVHGVEQAPPSPPSSPSLPVAERVMVANDPNLTLRVTVRPARPWARSRDATASAIRTTSRASSAPSSTSRAKVCSWLIDLTGRSGSTARSS